MNRNHGWMVVVGLIALLTVGCGGGGGGGSSVPASETTITGQITAPVVTTPGVLGSITETNNAALLAKLAASGTCTVNGQGVAFSLATATRFYQIPNLPAAASYDVRFSYGNLTLRTTFPYTSTYYSGKTINIDSTVKAWIMEQYSFTPAQMTSWEIKQEYVDSLAAKFQGWLKDTNSSLSGFQSRWTSELASLTTHVLIGSLTSDLTPAVDLTGTWKGANCVFYNLNLYGERAYKVTGDVSMTLNQSGNTVTGVFSIDVKSNELMPGIDLGAPEPDHLGSSIVNGRISSTRFTFTSGKESWEFSTLTDMMRGKVSNLDTNAFLGIESENGAFSLQRQR